MPSRYALYLPQAQQNLSSVVVVIENAPEYREDDGDGDGRKQDVHHFPQIKEIACHNTRSHITVATAQMTANMSVGLSGRWRIISGPQEEAERCVKGDQQAGPCDRFPERDALFLLYELHVRPAALVCCALLQVVHCFLHVVD